MTPKIVCLVGESGSGKSRLADTLSSHGFKELFSYTTRPKRDDKDNKICVTSEEFDEIRDDLVAYTLFDGHEYGATSQQVDECHVYVVDPAGVDMLAENIGRENFKVVYLNVDEEIRYRRLLKVRESKEEADRRIPHDFEKFAEFHLVRDYDISLTNNNESEFKDNEAILLALLTKWFPQK